MNEVEAAPAPHPGSPRPPCASPCSLPAAGPGRRRASDDGQAQLADHPHRGGEEPAGQGHVSLAEGGTPTFPPTSPGSRTHEPWDERSAWSGGLGRDGPGWRDPGQWPGKGNREICGDPGRRWGVTDPGWGFRGAAKGGLANRAERGRVWRGQGEPQGRQTECGLLPGVCLQGGAVSPGRRGSAWNPN